LREHLQAMAAHGRVDPLLEPVPIPPEVRPLWDVFVTLAACRRSGGMGASALCLADIDAWCRLVGATLTPWELETLIAVDAAALAAAHPRTE
jgi:hypothetical protein